MRPATGAVLPITEGPAITNPCRTKPERVAGYFSPTPGQIAAMEAGLARAVNPLLRMDGERFGRIEYHRQYMGLIRPDGRRSIYVSAFGSSVLEHRNADPLPGQADTVQWRTYFLDYCDGWKGFWGIEYDVETGEFSHFEHNGKA